MSDNSLNHREKTALLMKRAAYAAVLTALVLIAAKLSAWAYTGSVSILTTLVDSLLDAGASLLNLLAIHHALTPADKEHRFGHGKAEGLAALAQSAFITGSAVFLMLQAGERLVSPQPVSNSNLGIAVMVFSILATFILTRYQHRVVKQTGSVAIQADALHYVGDMVVNASVILALVLGKYLELPWIDPLFALLISCYILSYAWSIFKKALDMLMDRELPDDERRKIKELVLAHTEVLGLHDLRTRISGPDLFIQFHMELDGHIALAQSYAIAEEVDREICMIYPHAEIIVLQEPYGIEVSKIVRAQRDEEKKNAG
ncbi:cation diffusion facilitator family transporter [Kiloniella laminariae]|uniref:Cation diffusion facilitator family transporter n=1 Tax=Kiloniella laminariae TaxID=454162 RepID=A0ABT4LH86_9PROT|nr:cation diffusion facilitator family transporter [Kiloniella laminariae]MCZ4279357.1 cation diffusion facilitator family transporter [Kiloniella laminariae]